MPYTLSSLFITATNHLELSLRLRTNEGDENVDIVRYMFIIPYEG